MARLYDVEKGFDVIFYRPNANVFCPYCEDINTSRSKSCSVSINGSFRCNSCGSKGHVSDFYAKVYDITPEEAKHDLLLTDNEDIRKFKEKKRTITKGTERYKESKLTLSDVAEFAQALTKNVKYAEYLVKHRGLTWETLVRFRIGCDEHRITIPIFDEYGSVRNIRRYAPNVNPKMISSLRGDSTPCLYPLHILQNLQPEDTLIICEGEWDCILLNQLGFKAITNTGNCSTWYPIWSEQVVKHASANKIVIIYDVHDKKKELGQRMARSVARTLCERALQVAVLALPLPASYVGGDVTDWFMRENHTVDELQALLDTCHIIEPGEITDADIICNDEDSEDNTSTVTTTAHDVHLVSLQDAALANYYFKRIAVKCIVAGKRLSPYLIPKKISAIWEEGEETRCIEKTINKQDPVILKLVNCNDSTKNTVLRGFVGVPKNTQAQITVLSTYNIEELHVIPCIDSYTSEGQYTVRRCYYVGSGVDTNKLYIFEGITLPDPKNQQATHLFTQCTPSETDIDAFELHPEEVDRLRSVFSSNNVHDKLEHIASQMSEHITNIYGRADLHIAIDLAFHSPLQIEFCGSTIPKGWLDILVLGDTRTGKGFVTTRLAQYYGGGEIISGENLSFAGLVGGVQKLDDRWALVWGKMPLNDRRLIVLDECGGLPTTDIAKLSRVRSEGVAELTKIISEKTHARARLIWLGNPRPIPGEPKRMISDYDYGIMAVEDLIGCAEDISRFDFVLILAQDEVSSENINREHEKVTELEYTEKDCHRLLMWAWSRKAHHIKFSKDVESFVYRAAVHLGKSFHPTMCVVQAEDVRYKLLRIAVAAAIRTFNTDDGVNVRVNVDHIEFAYNFLSHIYSKDSCGYSQLSGALKKHETLKSTKAVVTTLKKLGDNLVDFIDGIIDIPRISQQDFMDYSGLDRELVQPIISELVRNRALSKTGRSLYTKRPAFKKLLIKVRAILNKDQHE